MDYETEPLLDEFTTWELALFQYKNELEEMEKPLDYPWGEDQEKLEEEIGTWKANRIYHLSEIFQQEEKRLEEKREYYFGCSFSTYAQHYNSRKGAFLEEFTDAREIDFIKEELEKGILTIPYPTQFIYDKIHKRMSFSLQKRFDFLDRRAFELGYLIKYFDPSNDIDGYCPEYYEVRPLKNTERKPTSGIEPLTWKGTPTELMELIKALVETNKIKGTQTEIIEKLTRFFQIEIKYPHKLLQDIKNRNNGSETLFLDHLKETLIEHIQK